MNPSEVVSDIDRRGFALVRGAIDGAVISTYLRALEAIYASRSDTNGDVAPDDFATNSGLTIDGLFAPLLPVAKKAMGAYYPDQSVFVSVAGNRNHSMGGIPFHTDGIIQGTGRFVLSMWAPLHECGRNAPGLAVVPASRSKVLRYLRRRFPGERIPGWHSDTDWNRGAFDIETLRAEFGEPFMPEMRPGDVMLFTNWTIHGSHLTAQMTKRRSAAIYRLKRKAWRERLRDHEFQLLGRRYNLKAWIDRHVP